MMSGELYTRGLGRSLNALPHLATAMISWRAIVVRSHTQQHECLITVNKQKHRTTIARQLIIAVAK
jgi:hypothetical protein